MQRNVKRVSIFFAVVLVLGVTGWVLWQRLQPPAWDRLLYQIYALPASTTADQLKQAGYLDLTAPQAAGWSRWTPFSPTTPWRGTTS